MTFVDVPGPQRFAEGAWAREEVFRALFEQAAVGIVLLSLDGWFLGGNRMLSRILGYTEEELRGYRFSDLVHPEDLVVEQPLLDDLLAGRISQFTFEKRYVRKDGRAIWVRVSSSRVMAPEPYRLSILEDITERKRMEAQLAEQAARLREADRRKNEFLAMLAHELRNPLAPIRNVLEVLRRTEGDGSKLPAACALLERQVAQLTRLVDDLLEVSRVSQGKIALRRERLALAPVIQQAVETSLPLIEARRHALSVALPQTPVWIEGDRARLVQVLGNLLNNAAKYSPEGGRIELHAELKQGELQVRVRDHGAGIVPELLPHIFEPFVQADRTLAHSQGGLGVGLTLAKRLVELHGGTIEAHSEGLGHGAEFRIRLPRAEPPADLSAP
ncbi:sensor histidine kinase [Candidatus Methylocalor cossyra]|uniref:histidine kinase n=1 Tax=Candidatus Methylocalor cossyra TaxID=3108543 RepID=A0ABM9NKJ1_9GAMM